MALAARALTLFGGTTEGSALYPEPLREVIGIESCFRDTVHTWQGAVRESRNMHPQMTNMQAAAHDAFKHIFASTGALAFVNEYAGSAAAPAPYNACAERQLACPCSPLSHTLGGVT